MIGFFGHQLCHIRAQIEMVNGQMTKMAVKISQNGSYFILIIFW